MQGSRHQMHGYLLETSKDVAAIRTTGGEVWLFKWNLWELHTQAMQFEGNTNEVKPLVLIEIGITLSWRNWQRNMAKFGYNP